ncbi:unnamed protein product [Musa textilis]
MIICVNNRYVNIESKILMISIIQHKTQSIDVILLQWYFLHCIFINVPIFSGINGLSIYKLY